MKRFLDLQKIMCLNGEETVFRIIRSEQDIAYYCISELELLSVAMFETRRHFGSSAECSNYKDTKFKGEGWYQFNIIPIQTGWSCTHEFRCIYLGKEAPKSNRNDMLNRAQNLSNYTKNVKDRYDRLSKKFREMDSRLDTLLGEDHLNELAPRYRQSGVKLFLDEVFDDERDRELREKLDKARDMEKVKEITKEEMPDQLKKFISSIGLNPTQVTVIRRDQDKYEGVKRELARALDISPSRISDISRDKAGYIFRVDDTVYYARSAFEF